MKRVANVLLLLLILSFSCHTVSAQDDDEWFIGKIITDFTFVGLDTVSIGDLRPIVRPYIGEEFTYELFWEIQGKLFALDYFDKIDAEAKAADEQRTSVVIEFRVKERPAVSEIRVTGNKRLGRGTILDKVLVARGDFITEADLNLEMENIRQLYLEKGFPNVEVEGRMEVDEESNEVTVIFEIQEGSETKVKEIYFSGNNFASDGTLKWQMQTKEQSLFVGGNFQENVLQEDITRIEDYYRENGYIDAEVVNIDRRIERDEENNRSFLILTIFIDEGDQYIFDGMTFEGNDIYTDEEIAEQINLEEGSVVNMARIERAYQKIVQLYTDNGYIYNTFELERNKDEEQNLISFHVRIEEFDKAHIENIILQGNDRTKDFVIERELPFEVGDIFSVERIRRGVYNLYNLRYFSAVDVKPVPGSTQGLMDLIINLEEQSWADFRFAISFSGGDFPLAAQVGWTDRNFLGTGRTIGVDLEGSPVRQGISFRFSDDHLFRRDWGGGVSVSFFHNLVTGVYQDIVPPIFTDEDVPDPYTSVEEYEDAIAEGVEVPLYSRMDYHTLDISAGVNTTYIHRMRLGRIGMNTGLSTTISYLWYDSDIYRPYSETVRDNLYAWDFINTWGNTIYWDSRDIYYNPTQGTYFSQYAGFTGGFLFGARDYIKLRTRAEAFFTLFRIPVTENFDFATILALHSSIAFLTPQIGGSLEITPADTLFIDGMTIGRGWAYRNEFKAVWDSSVELRHPLVKQFLWWTWFFDVVGAWREVYSMGGMSIDDYYFSYGFGLRFTIPGFPIRLYLSRNWKWEDGMVEWEDGDFSIGPHGFKFVISFTQPGGF